jgi:hypothetical protein
MIVVPAQPDDGIVVPLVLRATYAVVTCVLAAICDVSGRTGGEASVRPFFCAVAIDLVEDGDWSCG